MPIEGFRDERGEPMPEDRVALLGEAMAALLALSDHERGYVIDRFCRGCNRYVAPGESCYCERDE